MIDVGEEDLKRRVNLERHAWKENTDGQLGSQASNVRRPLSWHTKTLARVHASEGEKMKHLHQQQTAR